MGQTMAAPNPSDNRVESGTSMSLNRGEGRPAANTSRHHWMAVRMVTGASSSPNATCQPRKGYILRISATARSCRKSCRINCGPKIRDMPMSMMQRELTAGSKPESFAVVADIEASIRIDPPSNKTHNRTVNKCPAAIRFFQSKAMAGKPVGCSSNGGRFGFLDFTPDCQRPARAAAIRSAIFRDSSTEASSKATLERITHQ